MKKPILAAVGLAGACVACCSIPIALTLFSGLSAAGLTGWLLSDVSGPMAATALAVSVLGALWVWKARRAHAACATGNVPACSAEATGDSAGCGCGPKERPSQTTPRW